MTSALEERRADLSGTLGSDAFRLNAEGLVDLWNNSCEDLALDFALTRPNANGTIDAFGEVGVRVAGTIGDPNAVVTAERPDFDIGLANLRAEVNAATLSGGRSGYRLDATADTDYGPFAPTWC